MSSKDKVTNFDIYAALRALDELDYPEVEGYARPHPQIEELFESKARKNPNKPKFKQARKPRKLTEEFYSLDNEDDLENAAVDREEEIAAAKLAKIEKIVDLDAKTVDELEPSYVGKYIIQCPQCMTLFYKNQEDLVHDEADETLVNVGEACQHCGNDSGYTLIGKVDAVDEEIPAEENPIDEVPAEPTEAPVEEVPAEEIPVEEQPAEGEENLDLDDLNLNMESLQRSKAARSNYDTENHSENLTLNEELDDDDLLESFFDHDSNPFDNSIEFNGQLDENNEDIYDESINKAKINSNTIPENASKHKSINESVIPNITYDEAKKYFGKDYIGVESLGDKHIGIIYHDSRLGDDDYENEQETEYAIDNDGHILNILDGTRLVNEACEESLNNSEAQKDAEKHSDLATNIKSKNKTLHEADEANNVDYTQQHVEDALYYINKAGYFDFFNSTAKEDADEVMKRFPEYMADKKNGKAVGKELEKIDLPDGIRVKVKGLKIEESVDETLTEGPINFIKNKVAQGKENKKLASVDDMLKAKSNTSTLANKYKIVLLAVTDGKPQVIGLANKEYTDFANAQVAAQNYSKGIKVGDKTCRASVILDPTAEGIGNITAQTLNGSGWNSKTLFMYNNGQLTPGSKTKLDQMNSEYTTTVAQQKELNKSQQAINQANANQDRQDQQASQTVANENDVTPVDTSSVDLTQVENNTDATNAAPIELTDEERARIQRSNLPASLRNRLLGVKPVNASNNAETVKPEKSLTEDVDDEHNPALLNVDSVYSPEDKIAVANKLKSIYNDPNTKQEVIDEIDSFLQDFIDFPKMNGIDEIDNEILAKVYYQVEREGFFDEAINEDLDADDKYTKEDKSLAKNIAADKEISKTSYKDEPDMEISEEEMNDIIDTYADAPISEDEVEENINEIDGTFDEDYNLDELEDFDEASFEECATNSLKDVYENVKNFKINDVSLEEGKLNINGTITFNSGKTRSSMFKFTEAKVNSKNKNLIRLTGFNPTTSCTKIELDTIKESNNLSSEKLSYTYRINEQLVEGLSSRK